MSIFSVSADMPRSVRDSDHVRVGRLTLRTVPLLHPNRAHHYRAQVEELYTALQEDSEARRMEATDVPRSLVKEIMLTPDPDSGEL